MIITVVPSSFLIKKITLKMKEIYNVSYSYTYQIQGAQIRGRKCPRLCINPFMPTVVFNMCCPRDCVSRHNGGTSGAPLKPLRDDSALLEVADLLSIDFEL